MNLYCFKENYKTLDDMVLVTEFREVLERFAVIRDNQGHRRVLKLKLNFDYEDPKEVLYEVNHNNKLVRHWQPAAMQARDPFYAAVLNPTTNKPSIQCVTDLVKGWAKFALSPIIPAGSSTIFAEIWYFQSHLGTNYLDVSRKSFFLKGLLEPFWFKPFEITSASSFQRVINENCLGNTYTLLYGKSIVGSKLLTATLCKEILYKS
jgi:hypothetical protein